MSVRCVCGQRGPGVCAEKFNIQYSMNKIRDREEATRHSWSPAARPLGHRPRDRPPSLASVNTIHAWPLGALWPTYNTSVPPHRYPRVLPPCHQQDKRSRFPYQGCSKHPTNLALPRRFRVVGTWHRAGEVTKEKREACFPFTQECSVAKRGHSSFWVPQGPQISFKQTNQE